MGQDRDDQGGQRVRAELLRRSHRRFPRTLNLNLCGAHFSYISNLDKYSKSYACGKCGQCFNKAYNLQRHEITCESNVKHTFPGGAYHLPPTIFDKLTDLGVNVPRSLLVYPYRATFDFESYFQRVSVLQRVGGAGLTWENRHEILSCSVASNVPNFEEPACFVTTGSSGGVVGEVVDHLHAISEAVYELLLDRYKVVFEQLDKVWRVHDTKNQTFNFVGHN